MQASELEETLARLGVREAAAMDRTLGREAFSLAPTRFAHGGAGEAVRVPRRDSLPELVVVGEALAGSADRLADLEVLGTLGEGGMGLVRLARQVVLQREVAVKTLREGAGQHSAHALLREGLVAGRLDHPNVVPVHTLGRDAHGAPLIVMKRIEGVAWRKLVHDPGHPAWGAEAHDPAAQRVRHVEILVQVCRAIEFAHSRGIVHRDIKPDNVMIGAFGEVYVVDWGVAAHVDELAAASDSSGLVGTPAYMAPEMIAVGAVGPHSDVFLLGATLYEVLTGRAPNESEGGLMAALHAATERDHLEVEVGEAGGELATIVARATARDPAARFAGAGALREALTNYLRHRGSIALAERGREELAALRALLAKLDAGPAGDEAQRRALFERFTAAQVKLHGALDVWPENARARAALQDGLELMIDLALRERNVELADAMLAQLPSPDPSRAEAVAALRAELAAQRAAGDELRALRHEHDLGVGRRSRVIVVALITIAATGINVWLLFGAERTTVEPSRTELIGFMAFMLAVWVVTIAVARGRVAHNAINRRLASMLTMMIVMMLVHRLLSVTSGEAALLVMRNDLLLETAGLAAGAIGITPRLWPASACFLAAAVGVSFAPEAYLPIFQVTHIVAPLVAVLSLTRVLGGRPAGEAAV